MLEAEKYVDNVISIWCTPTSAETSSFIGSPFLFNLLSIEINIYFVIKWITFEWPLLLKGELEILHLPLVLLLFLLELIIFILDIRSTMH